MASDPFDDLLGAAATHLKDERQRRANEDATRRRAHEGFVAQVNEAIADWDSRIVPLVNQTVARGNELMSETGVLIAVVAELSAPKQHPLGAIPGWPGLYIVHHDQARSLSDFLRARDKVSMSQIPNIPRLELRLAKWHCAQRSAGLSVTSA